jgi:hypothetical protein
MARHHYVPQFLLQRWASVGRFTAYFWSDEARRVIENDKALVSNACQIPNLNVFHNVPAGQREWLENDYFTPRVDTPASDALTKMLNYGVDSLSWRERCDWARLLVSFGVRTPETLRHLGPQRAREAIASLQTPPELASEEERSADHFISLNSPTFEHNWPRKAAANLSSDPGKLLAIADMKWWLRRWDRKTIIIGDRPLLSVPPAPYPCGLPLNNPSCLIMLPVGPDAVFFACSNARSISRQPPRRKIAHLINQETIKRSWNTVFAADTRMGNFVRPKMYRHHPNYPALIAIN